MRTSTDEICQLESQKSSGQIFSFAELCSVYHKLSVNATQLVDECKWYIQPNPGMKCPLLKARPVDSEPKKVTEKECELGMNGRIISESLLFISAYC